MQTSIGTDLIIKTILFICLLTHGMRNSNLFTTVILRQVCVFAVTIVGMLYLACDYLMHIFIFLAMFSRKE